MELDCVKKVHTTFKAKANDLGSLGLGVSLPQSPGSLYNGN